MKCEGVVQLRMDRDRHVEALCAGKTPKTHRFTKIMPHLPCLTMPSPPTHGQIDDCRLSQRFRIFLAARQIRSGVSSHYSRDKSGVIPTIPSLYPVIQEMGYHTVNAFFISRWGVLLYRATPFSVTPISRRSPSSYRHPSNFCFIMPLVHAFRSGDSSNTNSMGFLAISRFFVGVNT